MLLDRYELMFRSFKRSIIHSSNLSCCNLNVFLMIELFRKVKRGKRSIKQRKAEEIQSIVNLKNFPQVQKSLTKKVLVPRNPQMKMNLLLRKMMTCSSQTTNFLANLMYLKPKLRSLNMREQLLKEGNANEGDLQKMKKWMWTRSQKKV